MRTLPFAAHLILQEMRNYLLISKVEELGITDLDTDDYMVGMSETVAALFGLPRERPDAWINTYTMYIDDSKRYDIKDKASLEALALQCYEALRVLSEGIKKGWDSNLGFPFGRN